MSFVGREWYRVELAWRLRRSGGRGHRHDRRTAYQEYLASERWRQLRREALQRDGWACRVCADTSKLNVHHRRNPRHWGTETIDDLTTLCRVCHERYHTDQRRGGTNAAFVAAALLAIAIAIIPAMLTSRCDVAWWQTQPVVCWRYSW